MKIIEIREKNDSDRTFLRKTWIFYIKRMESKIIRQNKISSSIQSRAAIRETSARIRIVNSTHTSDKKGVSNPPHDLLHDRPCARFNHLQRRSTTSTLQESVDDIRNQVLAFQQSYATCLWPFTVKQTLFDMCPWLWDPKTTVEEAIVFICNLDVSILKDVHDFLPVGSRRVILLLVLAGSTCSERDIKVNSNIGHRHDTIIESVECDVFWCIVMWISWLSLKRPWSFALFSSGSLPPSVPASGVWSVRHPVASIDLLLLLRCFDSWWWHEGSLKRYAKLTA